MTAAGRLPAGSHGGLAVRVVSSPPALVSGGDARVEVTVPESVCYDDVRVTLSPKGASADRFPVYGTSRTVAGGPIEGDVFACRLQPVERVLAQGVYTPWAP